MWILEQFSLYDVFLVAIGLVLASLIRIFYDSYKEKQRLNALTESLKIYNQSIDMYEEGVIMISDKNEIIFANKEAYRIFGSNDDILDMDYLNNKVKIRLEQTVKEENLLDAIDTKKNITTAHIVTDNLSVPVSINTNKFYMSYDRNSFWQVIVIQDLTSKIILQERIENIGSYKDLLTNLPTRHHLSHDLVSVILKSSEYKNKSALGVFGIKNFYRLRTSDGIEKADSLLRHITKDILDILLVNETLYVFDCDSFAIVFENSSDKEGIRKRLDYIVQRLRNTGTSEKFNVTTMQGLDFIDRPNLTAEKLINESFKAMHSKDSQRSINATDELNLKFGDTNAVSNSYDLSKSDFENALKNKDFFFFYQPIFDLKNDEFIGAEVLTRLNHKKYGFLLADNFMDEAIEYGMASEITAHLLDSVLSQKKLWSTEGKIDLDLTINLALSDFQSGIFTETLEAKLIEHKIDVSNIIIDISEAILAEDFELVIEEFYLLNKIGVKLSIDHFGREFVNLRHIEHLPLHSIKIDKSIIADMVGNSHKTRLVSSIISMGAKFDIKVGATHVDSMQTKILLEELDCDFAQGYYFGKAVPAFEINDLMNNN